MKINKTKEQIQVLVMIGIFIFTGYFVFFVFFFGPGLKKAGGLKSKVEDLGKKIKRTDQSLKDKDKIDESIKKNVKKIQDFELLMSKEDESWSIEQLDQIAKKNGVTIEKIEPNIMTTGKDYFSSVSKYGIRIINVSVSCNYHQFGTFINALERSSPFLKIKELEMTGGIPPEYTLKILFKVQYLVYKESETE